MIKEINLGGIYLSPFLGYAAAAGAAWYLTRYVLTWAGFYRFVWHPPLFNTALYVILLSILVGVTL